jgi:hypothetical protein
LSLNYKRLNLIHLTLLCFDHTSRLGQVSLYCFIDIVLATTTTHQEKERAPQKFGWLHSIIIVVVVAYYTYIGIFSNTIYSRPHYSVVMEVRGFRSALFIDTSARLCNLPAGTGTVTYTLKTVLLMLCNVVVAYIVSADLFCTDLNRSCMVSICCWVFTARVVVQMTFFWKRSIPWKEVVLESGGIIPLSLLTIACGCRGTVLCLEAEGLDVMHIAGGWLSLVSRLSGAHIDQSSSTQDCIGNQLAETDYLCLLMFFVGTYVNIWPEFQRYLWKRRPENARRLYTESLFAYARHVNYTGEILSFVGLCLLTGNMWTLWVPACMGAGLATFSIWEIEFYLQQRYAKEWPKYCRDTKALLVPGIY